MTEETLKDMMVNLKLRGMLAEFDTQTPGSTSGLSFNERLGILLQAECDQKRNNKIRNCNRLARFAQPQACVEEIIYDADRSLDRDGMARLASCSYISNHENVLALGASDSGKSYVGCALGNAACRHGIKTRYVRLAELFEEIERAEGDGMYRRKFSEFAKIPLLVLDDFMLSIPTVKQVQILLELVERREYAGSTIVCSQLHPSQWEERMDEKIQANSIYSRLVPGAHWIEIKGDRPMRERMRARS